MLTPSTVAVVAVVALVIFGPKKLPELARAMGRSLAEFRAGADEAKEVFKREMDVTPALETKTEAAEVKPDHPPA